MIVRRSIVMAMILVAITFVTVEFWISAFIYRPTSLDKPDPATWGLKNASFVRFPYRDGTAITGWWSPPISKDEPVILIVHGRSGNIASRASVMERLTARGMGVLLFDYRGYGASPGEPSEKNLNQDTLMAYCLLRSRGIPASRIVVIGQSLGNSPATMLAARRPIGALVLVSPFTSLPDALADRLPWFPVHFLPWSRNRFDVAASLRRYHGPLLLIASKEDGLVPIENARRLRAATVRSHWIDASPLRHAGMLLALAEDGRLARAVPAVLSDGRPLSAERWR